MFLFSTSNKLAAAFTVFENINLFAAALFTSLHISIWKMSWAGYRSVKFQGSLSIQIICVLETFQLMRKTFSCQSWSDFANKVTMRPTVHRYTLWEEINKQNQTSKLPLFKSILVAVFSNIYQSNYYEENKSNQEIFQKQVLNPQKDVSGTHSFKVIHT